MHAARRRWLRALAVVLMLAAGVASAAPSPSDVGTNVAEVGFVDVRGLERRWSDLGAGPIVVVFATPDCPLALRALPKLARRERELRARGVAFVLLDPSADASAAPLAAAALAAEAEFPVGIDEDGALARILGVERSPTVAILDVARHCAYLGRIDASLRPGGEVVREVRDDLVAALDDLLASRPVAVPRTPVEGCRLDFEPPRRRDDSPAPTWTGGVGEILRARCGQCHFAGGSAPFALRDFQAAARRAQRIAEVVRRGQMPPWHAVDDEAFVNRRRLSDLERDTLLRWAEGGAPAGDAARAAAEELQTETTPVSWRIGEPDLVLTQLGRTSVPAEGVLPYQYVVLPHVFAEDTWVDAVEILPSAKRAVHHANLGWVRLGEDFAPENFLTGYVPGGDVYRLEPGQAYRIPKGALLGLQVHYVTTGVAEQDVLRVGLRFPRATVQKRARHLELTDTRFSIPPFEPAHAVEAKRVFSAAATGIGMFVHMHLRGRDVRVERRAADGARESILCVPHYDFDWQSAYRWAPGARRFAAGDEIQARARFDNSAFNPFNPDPSAKVRFGQQTTDEMMYVFLFYTLDDEALGLSIDPGTGAAR